MCRVRSRRGMRSPNLRWRTDNGIREMQVVRHSRVAIVGGVQEVFRRPHGRGREPGLAEANELNRFTTFRLELSARAQSAVSVHADDHRAISPHRIPYG